MRASVSTVGLLDPFSMRLMLDCRMPVFSASSFWVMWLSRRAAITARIAAAMWQFDTLLDCTEEAQMDELFQRVKQIAGENAAAQINRAWNEALREKRAREKKRA